MRVRGLDEWGVTVYPPDGKVERSWPYDALPYADTLDRDWPYSGGD